MSQEFSRIKQVVERSPFYSKIKCITSPVDIAKHISSPDFIFEKAGITLRQLLEYALKLKNKSILEALFHLPNIQKILTGEYYDIDFRKNVTPTILAVHVDDAEVLRTMLNFMSKNNTLRSAFKLLGKTNPLLLAVESGKSTDVVDILLEYLPKPKNGTPASQLQQCDQYGDNVLNHSLIQWRRAQENSEKDKKYKAIIEKLLILGANFEKAIKEFGESHTDFLITSLIKLHKKIPLDGTLKTFIAHGNYSQLERLFEEAVEQKVTFNTNVLNIYFKELLINLRDVPLTNKQQGNIFKILVLLKNVGVKIEDILSAGDGHVMKPILITLPENIKQDLEVDKVISKLTPAAAAIKTEPMAATIKAEPGVAETNIGETNEPAPAVKAELTPPVSVPQQPVAPLSHAAQAGHIRPAAVFASASTTLYPPPLISVAQYYYAMEYQMQNWGFSPYAIQAINPLMIHSQQQAAHNAAIAPGHQPQANTNKLTASALATLPNAHISTAKWLQEVTRNSEPHASSSAFTESPNKRAHTESQPTQAEETSSLTGTSAEGPLSDF